MATRIAKLKLVISLVFAGAVSICLSVSAIRGGGGVAAAQQSLRFNHEQHLKVQGGALSCTDCHRPASEGSVTLKRPYHDSCTACHQQWFDTATQKKEACALCHTNVTEARLPDMTVFPNYNKDAAVLFDFSHKLHLGARERVAKFIGAKVECGACHNFDAKGEKATLPAHEECAACHSMPNVKPRLAADSKNQDCLACHTSKEQKNPAYRKIRRFIASAGDTAMVRGVKLIQPPDAAQFTPAARDLKFSHAKHLTDSRNAGITCETCHIGIDRKTTLAELSTPTMWDCTICHESQRTRAEFRISNCTVCHTQISAGRKPRSHTLTERPYDHTAAFRVRHAEAARASGAKCAFCHEFTPDPRVRAEGFIRTEERALPASGNCDECHSVMKPASHTIRWRSDLHGRMASLNRINCTVCHQVDYCIRCHNTRPRSHNPINAFVNGGHRFLAQLNQRSCFTCHEYNVTCERCHNVRIR
ncbi:MAG TPA: cytochrome c3 family protein [Blastocatellia bacterium]|nr:cytochrome c3 family protein [Blastocatellia bacterium]